MRLLIFFIVLLFIGCKTYEQTYTEKQVSKLHIDKRYFFTGNTSAGAYGSIVRRRDDVRIIDTTNVNIELFTSKEFIAVLNEAGTIKKHYQRKIGGIDFTGYFVLDGKRHYYLVCGYGLIVDLTDKKDYYFNKEEDKKFNDFVSLFKPLVSHELLDENK